MHDASAIKKTIFSILIATACSLPAAANEDEESGIPPLRDLPDFDAAAKEIRNLAALLKAWGDTMIAHPVEDELVMGDYEVNYLPKIRQTSAEIRREGERLKTYGYFGSTLLKDALIDLVRQTL